MAESDSRRLKRYMDAVKGRPLSWSLAAELELITRTQCSGGDKLGMPERHAVQKIIDEMVARGVKPAATLLSPYQQAAQRKRVR